MRNPRVLEVLVAAALGGCASSTPDRNASRATPPATPVAPIEAPANPLLATAAGAMLFDDLGELHYAITTRAPEAQKYFDQGLRLTYGFNHDEATRSFARGAELDPTCAMCFWGAAMTMGPNYNVPMLPDRAKTAWEALQRAVALAPGGTPVEQALIGALAKRYAGPEPLMDPSAQQPYNEAYAAAMREVAHRFPDDVDVQVLFAESLMDVNPWKLYTVDGTPAPGTDEIVRTLESALARAPGHPGANHYYIHAVEASAYPDKGLAAADRLPTLIPGAGHILHMPAHIFQRVGRYADASEANRRAVAADLAYLARTTPPGYYPMYLGHNYGFLAYSASMEGRGEESLQAARATQKALPPGMIDMMPGMDFFIAEPLLVMVRFGNWDELLAEPRPDAKYQVLTGFWLHGHGMALAAKGRFAEALADHAVLLTLANDVPKDLLAGLNPARAVLALAAKVLEARMATLQKQKNALDLWAEAVRMEDGMAYSEPADWFYPVRHLQGAALLAAGKAKDAEAVFREDLRRNPENGWALFGLAEALKAQHRGLEEKAVRKRFDQAWARADVNLKTTAF